MNTKGENMAPLAFQSDPEGTYHDLAVQLRNSDLEALDAKGTGMAFVESFDRTEDTSSPPRTSKAKTARGSEETPAQMEEIKFKKQQEILTSWIDDPRHAATPACRHSLELYAQLNDSEFLYVSDLQSTYDEARCFFLQWVLGKEIKELVNSARISAVQAGKKFTWRHARDEVFRSLTDTTYTVRFLALARLKRQSGSAAKIWISQVLTRKALLEDPKLPSPIALPEAPRRSNVGAGDNSLRLPLHRRRPVSERP
jgi:hypothetical protein